MGPIWFPGQQATEVRPLTLVKQKYLELMKNYSGAIKPNISHGVNTLWTRAEPRCLYGGVTQLGPGHGQKHHRSMSTAQGCPPKTLSQQSHVNPTVRHHLLSPACWKKHSPHQIYCPSCLVIAASPALAGQLMRSTLYSRHFLIHFFALGEVCQARSNHPLETLKFSEAEQGTPMQTASLVWVSRSGNCINKQHSSVLMGEHVTCPGWERVTSRKVLRYWEHSWQSIVHVCFAGNTWWECLFKCFWKQLILFGLFKPAQCSVSTLSIELIVCVPIWRLSSIWIIVNQINSLFLR